MLFRSQNVTPREQKFVDIVNKSDEIRNGASKNPNFSPEKVNSLLKEHADQSAKNLGFTGASDPRFADSLDDAVRSVNDAGTKLNQLKNLKAQLDQLKPNKGAISKILHSFGKESATGAVTEIASTLGGLPPGLAATIVGMGAEHFLPTPQGASGYTTQQAKGLISRLGLPPEPKSGVKAALKQAPGLVGRAAAVGAGSKLRQGLLGPTVLGLNNQ